MPKYEVIIEVDGETHREEVSAPDCRLAMNKALKLHPVKVLSITPLEEQLDLDRDHHPGQEEIFPMAEEIAMREADLFGEPRDLMAALKTSLEPAPELEDLDEQGAVA